MLPAVEADMLSDSSWREEFFPLHRSFLRKALGETQVWDLPCLVTE